MVRAHAAWAGAQARRRRRSGHSRQSNCAAAAAANADQPDRHAAVQLRRGSTSRVAASSHRAAHCAHRPVRSLALCRCVRVPLCPSRSVSRSAISARAHATLAMESRSSGTTQRKCGDRERAAARTAETAERTHCSLAHSLTPASFVCASSSLRPAAATEMTAR